MCFLPEERCIYLQGIVTKFKKKKKKRNRKLWVTNIGLFHSHFCAPTLLFIILVSVTQEGHCFLSWHLLMCISFAMVSHTQTVHWIQWELSWPEAARISLCHYLNELCCVGFFFAILLYIQQSTICFSVQILIKTNIKNHIHCTVYF